MKYPFHILKRAFKDLWKDHVSFRILVHIFVVTTIVLAIYIYNIILLFT